MSGDIKGCNKWHSCTNEYWWVPVDEPQKAVIGGTTQSFEIQCGTANYRQKGTHDRFYTNTMAKPPGIYLCENCAIENGFKW